MHAIPTPRRATTWRSRLAGSMALAALIAGCASGPARLSDGPEANPPPDLGRVPDAEPRVEPIRPGGPNKPYDALGKSYVPITQDAPFTERGVASWYGRAFHGRKTASGEIYNMYAMTAAHPTLPIPSYARIRNPANGREIVVRINDRGPFHGGRIVDLSYTAALRLDLLRGVGPVELQRITSEDIRTGAWRRAPDADATRLAAQGASTVAVPAAAVVPIVATSESAAALTVSGLPTIAPAPSDDAPPRAATGIAATPVAPTPIAVTPIAPTPIAATSGAASALADPAPVSPAVGAQPVADAPTARAFTSPARGYWVQLGAFRARDGAESFHQRVAAELEWLSPLLAVFGDAALFKLQAGPYPSRDEARGVAERVRDGLRLVPVIVERR